MDARTPARLRNKRKHGLLLGHGSEWHRLAMEDYDTLWNFMELGTWSKNLINKYKLHVLDVLYSCPAKLKKPPGFSGYLWAVEAKLSLTELRIGWSQRAANPTAMPMPASSPCVNKGARRPPFFNMFLWYTPNAMAITTIWGCLLEIAAHGW